MHARPTLVLVGLALASALAAATPATAGGSEVFPYPVHRTTLENGLRIVVIPYDSPGTVAYFTVVRAGSRQEVEAGHSGFAHFFEHMMFRGTDKYPADVYNDELKRMGADSNAFTTDDYTNYYIIGPSAELEKMMDLESDRFENLKYSENTFRTEALAVLGEYNKNASSPFLPMFEKLRDLAFEKHTYKHTTMGFLADIKAMPGDYDYSRSFFDRFYRPENALVLVVGDVQPQRVFTLAKRYYGGWKKGYEPVKIPPEPPQKEAKEGHIDWPGPIRPHLMIGYHIPAFSTADTESAALDLIGQLLFSDSAPLYKELVVDRQWVDGLEGGPDSQRDPYLFTVFARVKTIDLVPKVEKAIADHIAELEAKPVDGERLDRIKSHLKYAFALGLDSPGSVAFRVASFLNLTGDPASINQLYAQYDKVTPADVQRVAKQIFTATNRTTVTLSHREPTAPGAATTKEGR